METPKPNLTETDVVPVWDWVLTLLLTLLPLINLVMLFIWAFGENTNPSKANYAKASLFIFAALALLYLLIALLFGSLLFFYPTLGESAW